MLIRYMGTKRWLADTILRICELKPAGPFVDAFSGMNSVAANFFPTRNVWTNDIQKFSYLFSKSIFTSSTASPIPISVISTIRRIFKDHLSALVERHSDWIARELEIISEGDPNAELLKELYLGWDLMAAGLSNNAETVQRRSENLQNTHTLFTETYAGTYLGIYQSMEIDSLRFALERIFGSTVDEDPLGVVSLLALGRALDRCGTTPGHFAQPLTPNKENIRRFTMLRKRSIWDLWEDNVSAITPIGSHNWRRKNIVSNLEASEFLKGIKQYRKRPSIIYLDPPYTKDQYSRYYHIYETLVLYDYPDTTGRGRYRTNRFSSPYCLKSRVSAVFSELISLSSQTGGDIILSYPENGLLHNSGEVLYNMLLKYYRSVEVHCFPTKQWSTLGARHGKPKTQAYERLYVTSGAR